MTRFLKDAAKRILRRYHRLVVQTSPDRASGFSLSDDLKFVVPGAHPICLDVGANEGELIDLFLNALDRPLIHAFEPSSVMFPRLQAKRYGESVVLHKFAMGSRVTTATLTNYEGTWMNSLLPLDPDERNPLRECRGTGTETVEVKTIDWFVERQGLAVIDLLKIDTQGFELEVLKGAAESLRRGHIRSVIVELMFEPLYQGQGSPFEILELLAAHDLRLVDYYDKFRAGHRLARCNALFMKVERRPV